MKNKKTGINFELFDDLFGEYVQMGDRIETIHVWSKKLALINKGRWIPKPISEEKYNEENDKLSVKWY